MKKDCPNCLQSMDGKFLHWRKFAKMDHFRVCPICGKDIEFQFHAAEIAVRVLTALLVFGGFYWAKERGAYLQALLVVLIALAIAYSLVHWLLRDQQRFRKARTGR
ncbi:MAG: hypothetical protein M3R58_18095 [Pseudomonadota bacterium]|nr:hypothetical protein [Pseudomonadota bacterium]